jgi:4-hydroxy-tetrahydrodipicolinate reductase
MKIILIGYGKMGKEIEQIALKRGHTITDKIDVTNTSKLNNELLSHADVAIEFTSPHSAIENIYKCFDANLPVVVGTTGWLEKINDVKEMCEHKNGTLFYASNFSVGVNIFFKLNSYLAEVMSKYADYDVTMEEIHHIHKLDAPSGTAITLAEGVLEKIKSKAQWVNQSSDKKNDLVITSKRENEVPGTHIINYQAEVDAIEIKHTAHSRKGFALGAVFAAEFIQSKKGIYGMNDLLNI